VLTRDGFVYAVAFSGRQWQARWLASRAIAVSAISTANLYTASQLGGSCSGSVGASLQNDDQLSVGDPVRSDLGFRERTCTL
jgi:hypothetical protein